MLNRLVESSLRYRFLVLISFAVVAFLGLQAVALVRHLDADHGIARGLGGVMATMCDRTGEALIADDHAGCAAGTDPGGDGRR